MKVPLFDLAKELAPIRAELDAAIARVLDSGVVVGGPEVAALERELAVVMSASHPNSSQRQGRGNGERSEQKPIPQPSHDASATSSMASMPSAIAAGSDALHAIAVSSCSDALHATFMALDVGPGTEVVTTPFTFFATAGSAARLGARIVFADIDPDTLTLDPRAALAACSSRTRAIVPVHLFGHPAAIPRTDIAVIEDSAHRPAAPLGGRAAVLSFFPTKNLGALGDGGAILTHDAALADRLVLLRSHGARPKYHHLAIGGNFRIDALQAAVVRTKLPHLVRSNAARRANAVRYRALFAAAKLPPELRLPAAHAQHAYHQFVIRAPRRDGLRAHLATSGVGTEVYYPEPLHLAPCFAEFGYRAGAFPHAERACSDVLALPIHPALSADAQAFVVEQIVTFYAK